MTAKTWSVGLVWQPHFEIPFLENISASIDYYDIQLQDAIGSIDANTLIQGCYNANGTSNPTYSTSNGFCALLTRDPLSLGIVGLNLIYGAFNYTADPKLFIRSLVDYIGTDRIEVQADAITPGQRVVVVDDLLATGGTMAAAIALLRKVGADVRAAACIIELAFLGGRTKLNVPFSSVVSYDS